MDFKGKPLTFRFKGPPRTHPEQVDPLNDASMRQPIFRNEPQHFYRLKVRRRLRFGRLVAVIFLEQITDEVNLKIKALKERESQNKACFDSYYKHVICREAQVFVKATTVKVTQLIESILNNELSSSSELAVYSCFQKIDDMLKLVESLV